MKAVVYEKYGKPSEVLEFREVEKPAPKDNQVLIKIYATSINYADNAAVRGKPFLVRATHGLLKPKNPILGTDIAGKIEAVGGSVKKFQPGDEVYGDLSETGFGAFAEYASAPETASALKPVNLTYEEAAAIPQYALVALQGLRDKGQVQPGHKVLINGASGGIGIFAVQIAKYYGAEVTGVCSTRNLELVRSLGADHIIDYTQEDFSQKQERYDIVLDIVANRPLSDYMRVLTPMGHYIAVAFNPGALLRGQSKNGPKVTQLSHEPSVDDLLYMKELIESGEVRPVIAKRFPLSKTAEALEYYSEGNPSGKVVVTMEHNLHREET